MPGIVTRGYWITVALVYLAAYVVVLSWAVTAGNPRILWWTLVLSFAAYGTWLYRANEQLARLAAVAPLLVIVLTGLLGRWPWR